MSRLAALLAICAVALAATQPVHAADNPPALKCDVGPVTKAYGGSSWLVYSCHDGQSLTLVAAPGSPASPFYFSLFKQDGKYVLAGEGKGAKSASDSAQAELARLSAADIAELIAETLKVTPAPSLLCNIGPADELLGGQAWHAYACDDGKTVYVTVSPEPYPIPIPIFFYWIDGHYKLQVLPQDEKLVTAAGLAALRQLDDAGVQKLMADAKQAEQDLDAADALLRRQLVGHWVFNDTANDNDLFFGADGSFSWTARKDGKLVWTTGGTWIVERSHIVYTYTLSAPHPEKAGLMDIDRVSDLTPECFTMTWMAINISRPCRAH